MSHWFRMSSQRRASTTDSRVLAGGSSTQEECRQMGGCPTGRQRRADSQHSRLALAPHGYESQLKNASSLKFH